MNDDVLTHEERTTVEELREMAQHGFYSVAAGFDAKCVAVIDRLVADVERLRRLGTFPVCWERTVERDRYARALRRQARAWFRYRHMWKVQDRLQSREQRGPWRETWKGWKR